MKKHLLVFLLCGIFFCQFTTGQNFHWVRSFGSYYNDNCKNVASDNYGNTYVAGNFGFVAATWNGGSYYNTTPYMYIGEDSLMNVGVNNDYLVKYDKNGNLVWALSIGGLNGYDYLEGIGGLVYDSVSDYIYLSGNGTGGVVIGSFTIVCSNSDVFLAKLDLNGNCIWGKNFIGSGYDFVRGMCIDQTGSIYLTGQNPDPMTIQSINVEAGGFLAKFDSSGTCLWAKKEFPTFSPPDYVIPMKIKVSNAEIIIGGYTTINTVTIDTLSITDTNYNSSYGYNSGLLAKFDSLGNVKWAKFLGSPCSAIWAIDIDPEGAIYNAGWFQNTCFFDTLALYGSGGYIVKCNPSGSIVFLNKTGATGYALPYDIQTDKTGNCYATGITSGIVTFGGTTFTNDGAFLVKYYSDGAVGWAKQIKGGYMFENYLAISVNSDGSVIALAGNFSDSITIDSTITIHNSGSKIYGSGDVFVVRYDGLVGIEDKNLSSLNSMLIFPNPTSEKFYTTIPVDFNNQNSLILSLIDNVGKIVQKEIFKTYGDKIILNVQNLSKGFYIVSLSNGQKSYYGKLIIE